MYLPIEGKQAAVGDGLAIVYADSTHPDESGGFPTRFIKALRDIIARHTGDGDVLIVTHGDGLAVAADALRSPQVVLEVKYCGVLAFDADMTSMLYSNDVEYLAM